MAFIEVIGPDRADGKLAELYRRVSGPDGQVDNVAQAHSLRPHSLEGHMALYKAVLHHPRNTLAPWFHESIGVLVSRLNGCEYCFEHHSAGLQRLLADETVDFDACMAALDAEKPGSPFTPEQAAALRYATQLTRAPGSIREVDIDALRKAGLADGEILEVNQVASYFAYANRTVSGLGVTTAGERLGLSPEAAENPGDWSHS